MFFIIDMAGEQPSNKKHNTDEYWTPRFMVVIGYAGNGPKRGVYRGFVFIRNGKSLPPVPMAIEVDDEATAQTIAATMNAFFDMINPPTGTTYEAGNAILKAMLQHGVVAWLSQVFSGVTRFYAVVRGDNIGIFINEEHARASLGDSREPFRVCHVFDNIYPVLHVMLTRGGWYPSSTDQLPWDAHLTEGMDCEHAIVALPHLRVDPQPAPNQVPLPAPLSFPSLNNQASPVNQSISTLRIVVSPLHLKTLIPSTPERTKVTPATPSHCASPLPLASTPVPPPPPSTPSRGLRLQASTPSRPPPVPRETEQAATPSSSQASSARSDDLFISCVGAHFAEQATLLTNILRVALVYSDFIQQLRRRGLDDIITPRQRRFLWDLFGNVYKRLEYVDDDDDEFDIDD
ncbi:hypothetical protein CPB85DRAFT_1445889 [Mucidula mucida]|nr:hypothetical protein CPB85DRAFT_1445889 [Mucidula mucida]